MIKTFHVLLTVLCLSPAALLMADGMIVVPHPPNGDPFPLSITYHRVKVDIENQVAVTTIEQEFHNPGRHQLHGYYLFPIPAHATIEHFAADLNGKMMQAELLPADKARRYYEDIVRKLLDPALLEYSNQGVYRMRIFPINPNENKTVTITYRELLRKDFDRIDYLYPLNTEKFSATPLKQVSIHIDLKTSKALQNILCPTHEVDIVRKSDQHAVITYKAKNVIPDRDFNCFFQVRKSTLAQTLFTCQPRGEEGFFMLAIHPDLQSSKAIPKDMTFVLDNSGSMNGKKMDQAKKALRYCIEHLNPEDRFDIIRFSTEAFALFGRCVDAAAQNLNRARRFVDDLESVGGTNMEAALHLALQNNSGKRPHLILLITDGKPTIGETDETKLLTSIENTSSRIFAFGIGYEINTHLLDNLSKKTRATRRYHSPDEHLQSSIASFYDKIKSPALTNIDIDFGSMKAYQYYPAVIPDLFKGSSITLLGRYRNNGNTKIVLKGDFLDEKKSFVLEQTIARQKSRYEFLPVLWALRRVGYLLDLIRIHGEKAEIVDEIVHLARTHGIVTPYTSYLIVEDEVHQPQRRNDVLTYGNMPVFQQGTGAQMEEERQRLKKKSGQAGVERSEEFYNLYNADQVGASRQGEERIPQAALSTAGRQNAMIHKAGRAFYQSGDFWVDSYLQSKTHVKKERIRFGSKAYFDFVRAHPQQAPLLALGKNVRFYMNDIYYEVYE